MQLIQNPISNSSPFPGNGAKNLLTDYQQVY